MPRTTEKLLKDADEYLAKPNPISYSAHIADSIVTTKLIAELSAKLREGEEREEEITKLIPDIKMGLFMLTERCRELRNGAAGKLAKSKFQYRLDGYEELFKKVSALTEPTPPKKES